MTEEYLNNELRVNGRPPQNNGNNPVSDDVIIEIVHAFKDIIIEFINRKYQRFEEK